MQHSYFTWYMSLQNNIKLSQTVWELLPVQYFGFRGDKYIMKKVRVVFLERETPTGPLLHPYQILSEYLWGYQSYRALKDASSYVAQQQKLSWTGAITSHNLAVDYQYQTWRVFYNDISFCKLPMESMHPCKGYWTETNILIQQQKLSRKGAITQPQFGGWLPISNLTCIL